MRKLHNKSIAIIGHVGIGTPLLHPTPHGECPDIVSEEGIKTYTYKNAIIDMPDIMLTSNIKSPKEFGQQKLGINKKKKEMKKRRKLIKHISYCKLGIKNIHEHNQKWYAKRKPHYFKKQIEVAEKLLKGMS